ncbi:MAG: hypothetical protein ABSH00_10345 [Bryobacteraceae bacterium]|jgi:hypothetical protein
MRSRHLWRLLLILGLLLVGWGPLFVADWVKLRHPDFNAEGFGSGWGIGITLPFSFLAVALTLFFAIRLIVARVARFIEQRREGPSPGQAGGPEEK